MRLPIVLGLVALSVSCGKSNDDDKTTQENVDSVIATLNQAYPGALSLSVFPQDNLASTSGKLLEDTSSAPENIKAKAQEADKLLKGTADNCLPPVFLRLPKALNESCYQFDQEMLYSGNQGTSNGKSRLPDSSEACLVSYARSQIKTVEAILDQGLGMQQGMICQAIKDDVDVSKAATAEGVDLKQNLQNALAAGPTNVNKPKFTVNSATMAKDSDGVYRVKIELAMTTPDNKTINQTYRLNHVPDSDDNSTYHGVISIVRDGEDGPGNGGKTRFMSLAYSRTATNGETRLQAQLLNARFSAAYKDKALSSNGTVDLNVVPDQAQNSDVDGIRKVAFDLNTDNDTGTFEYWENPGANINEAARGMVFKVEKATDGRLNGCGMSGAASGLSIRKAVKTEVEIKPNGSYHPFLNTEGTGFTCGATDDATKGAEKCTKSAQFYYIPAFSVAANQTGAADWAKKQMSNWVTRQCVVQNASTGAYEIDTTKITDTAGYELFKPAEKLEFVIGPAPKPKDPPPPPRS